MIEEHTEDVADLPLRCICQGAAICSSQPSEPVFHGQGPNRMESYLAPVR